MSDEIRTITDVACTVCGCVCDDLEVQVAGQRIERLHRACHLAEPWFHALNDRRPPTACLHGEESNLDEAMEQAAAILKGSRNPLIFGLSRSSTQGQRAAVHLAERLQGNIDTTASVCHGPSIVAIQQVGESTCTLGEARNRADLVIFWGADPAESHPRHFERYSVDPVGEFLPGGRHDRTVIVIDKKPTATSSMADQFFQVQPEQDFEVIWRLRQLIAGDEPRRANRTGLTDAELHSLAVQMKSCRYGIVFFGLGLAQRGLGHLTVDALLRMVAELNAHTRFCARRLRIPGDVSGADSVLCWQTGFPFAVNFSRGFPRYNPGEFSAEALLSRGEVDACLLVGSESVPLLSQVAQSALRDIPTIVLDYPQTDPSWLPTIRFTTAVYGVHEPGTVYRMDEIPVPLRRLLASHYPTDEDVLTELLNRLGTA